MRKPLLQELEQISAIETALAQNGKQRSFREVAIMPRNNGTPPQCGVIENEMTAGSVVKREAAMFKKCYDGSPRE